MTEPTARYVIEIIVIGIVATLVTDIWQRLLQAIAGVPPARWGLIGRWVAGFPRGVFVHQSIAAAKSVRGELALGWAFHYAIGIAWAAPLCCDHEVWLGLRPDAHFRAGGFTRAARRALVRHAARARHGLHGFAHAEACRGSRNEFVGAHGFWDRPLPWRDWLGLVGRGGVSFSLPNPSAIVPTLHAAWTSHVRPIFEDRSICPFEATSPPGGRVFFSQNLSPV